MRYNSGMLRPFLCLIALALPVRASGMPPASRIIGQWDFDEAEGERAVDSSGSGSHGTIHGTTVVPGRSGSARSFNGVSDIVVIEGTRDLDLASGGFTLEAWFKASTARGGDSALVGKYDWSNRGSNGYFLSVTPNVGHVSFFVDRDPRLISSASYLDGRWHHAAGVYDGKRQYLYVDGRLEGTQPIGRPLDNPQDITIGAFASNIRDCAFLGGIDSVRVLAYPATAAEIARDAAGAPPAVMPRAAPVVQRLGQGPWSRAADVPVPVLGPAVAEIGGVVYLAGGYRGAPQGLREYDSLWAFDPERGSWRDLPALPFPRYCAAAGVMDGQIHVAGGASLAGGVPEGHQNVFSDRLEVYDPRRETWTSMPAVPAAGMSRGAVLGGAFYVMGENCSSLVQVYVPGDRSWRRGVSMLEGRCSPGVAALDGKLYAIGGNPLSGPPHASGEVFDPETGVWTALPPMPTARTTFMTAVLGGRIHVLGGWTGSQVISSHEVFDPGTGRWYSAAPLPAPRSGGGAAAVDGKLYVFGGQPTMSADTTVSETLVYDPSKDRLRPISSVQPVVRVQQPLPLRPPSLPPDLMPARRGRERPDDFSLVVGVERYRSLPAASYAERDASAFARYARAVLGVPEENTILLTGERATKTDIAKYVEEWLPRNVVEASRVYVFYSGHGAPDPAKGTAHLVPWDGDPAFLQTSAYPLSRLYDRLSRLKAREVVVMLDACFSGVGGRSVIAPGLRPLVLVKEAVVPKGDKLTVLTAASSDETAGSLDSQRHGLFTYYLLKGLDGAADPEGSGHVDVDGLHGYVRQNVLRAARRQNREQNPVLRAPDKGLRLY